MGEVTVRTKRNGVVSFPKAGRTWIRLFLDYYRKYTGLGRKTQVIFRHGDEFDFKKRVLLIRHPCDVMVSYYLHQRVRRRIKMPVERFIRNKRYGIPAFNKKYAAWSERMTDQLIVRYEDMFGVEVWVAMLEFFGIPIREEAFGKAIEMTKFDTVRSNLHKFKEFPSTWRYLGAVRGRYNLVNPVNPDGHKFRRGKVGGYVDYLDEGAIDYILDNFTLGENLESYRQEYLLESARRGKARCLSI